MSIFLISLGNRAKCWIVFLKRTKVNFFHNLSFIRWFGYLTSKPSKECPDFLDIQNHLENQRTIFINKITS